MHQPRAKFSIARRDPYGKAWEKARALSAAAHTARSRSTLCLERVNQAARIKTRAPTNQSLNAVYLSAPRNVRFPILLHVCICAAFCWTWDIMLWMRAAGAQGAHRKPTLWFASAASLSLTAITVPGSYWTPQERTGWLISSQCWKILK